MIPTASSSAPLAAVQLTGVTKRFRKHVAVDRLSLTVPKGAIYGFIGPNGSGKTTVLRMILRIFQPDEGEVVVLGEGHSRAANDRIGYLPEERGLYKKMSVRRALLYYAALKGMSRSTAEVAMAQWLERMELTAWSQHKVEALSKGMAQKIQFIAAVLARPELIILDEPFSGLDPVNLEAVRAAIVELRQNGATIILSTHAMETAEKMCDSICMIYRGRKVLDGTLQSIQAHYGEDTIRLRVQGGAQHLSGLPGLRGVRDLGQYQEVRYQGDAQELLRMLLAKTEVHLFEIARPSLHDIFVRIAGPTPFEQEEVKHA